MNDDSLTARILGDRSPRRAAEEPLVDLLPLAVVLGVVAGRARVIH